MALLDWAKQPRLLPARLRYWVWEKLNPDKPWLCPGTIAFCEAKLSSTMKAFEFGSGRSTIWLARLVGHLISVEYDERWYQEILRRLDLANVRNVDYLSIPLEHARSAPEQASYDPLPKYVGVLDRILDHSLDLIVIDGHYRANCIRHAVPKLASGGYLIVDDVIRWSNLVDMGIPPGWRVVDDSSNGIKRCIIWQAS